MTIAPAPSAAAAARAAAGPGIELWFDFASHDSDPSIMRIEAEAAKHQLPVIWRPFLLGPIAPSSGWNRSPFALQKRNGDDASKDMARQYRPPALLALQVAMIGAGQRWIGSYCRRIASLNHAGDRELDDPARIEQLLSELWLPAQQILADARSEANQQALRAQTGRARALGLSGAPGFIVDGALFQGDDGLDEALAHAVQRRLARAAHGD